MLATHFGHTPIFPSIMAGDDMEISSEHGHNAGEDIDIDIDLTGGQVDEDYVLEDAEPDAGQDDPMVDEDDTSFPMDDEDLIQDEDNQNMDHGITEMRNMATSDLSNNNSIGIEITDTFSFGKDVSSREPELMWDLPEVPNEHIEDAPVQPDSELTVPDGEGAYQIIRKAQEPTSPQSAKLRSPAGIVTGEPIQSPSYTALGAPDSGNTTSSHPDPDLGAASVSGEPSNELELTSSDHINALSLSRKVVVAYQSTDYALFSASESDDPDSYFLSDLTFTEKPLVDLFAAIRNVIHEDLSADDELCVSVEDLGLEFNETSAPIHEVTFGQIMSLHEKLLRNDGVESPSALYIFLGTRPNYFSRLANLTAGAAEGKGLSELVTWDEYSESRDESAEIEKSKYGDSPTVEEPGTCKDGEDTVETAEGKVIEISDSSLVAHPEQGLESIPEPSDHQTSSTAGQVLTAGSSPPTSSDPQQKTVAEMLSTSAPEEYDEDGDLIDYEDEELGQAQRGAQPYPTELEADDSRTHNEYEAINENLRRRSISRTAEDDHPDQSLEQTQLPEDSRPTRENVTEVEDGVEYDDENDEEVEHESYNGLAEHNGPSADYDGLESALDIEDHEDEPGISYGATDKTLGDGGASDGGEGVDRIDDGAVPADDLTFEVKDSGAAEQHAQADNYHQTSEDELELEDDDTKAHSLPELQQEDIEANGVEGRGVHENESNTGFTKETQSISSSLGFVDTAESESATASANTLDADEILYEEGLDNYVSNGTENSFVAQTSNDGIEPRNNEDSRGGEPQDEIDYEDDKEQGVSKPQNIQMDTEKLPISSGGAGKRARADADPEDTLNTRVQEAKRARS